MSEYKETPPSSGQAGTVVATYSYDEFGNQLSVNGQPSTVNEQGIYNPLRYSGAHNAYYDSETSLYKMGARYYQPDVGRWLTRDDYTGNQENSQTRNRYIYVENNPLTNADPSGFMSVRAALGKARYGDVILSRGGWWAVYGYWSHAALVVKSNKKRRWGDIVEAVAPRTRRTSIKTMFKATAVGVFQVRTTGRIKQGAVSIANKYARIGIPYHIIPYSKLYPDTMYCTKLVYQAYLFSSLANHSYVNLDGRWWEPVIRPDSIEASGDVNIKAWGTN